MRKLIAVLATTVLLGACGGGSDDEAASTTAAATPTTAASTTSAAPTTASPAASASGTATTVSGGTGAAAAAETIDASMVEWSIEAPTTLTAGQVTVNATNNGEFGHEFVVYKGTFDSLPKAGNGSVDEDALAPGALVGRIDRMDSGSTGSGTFDLEPGSYAFVCNLVGGGNSHAARGQRLDVTVA